MIGLDALINVGGKLIDKLIPDPEAKAKAQLELQKMAQDGELAKMANETKLFEVEQNNLTERVKADMASDSWLSKNIRPFTLIFLLISYSGRSARGKSNCGWLHTVCNVVKSVGPING